MGERGLLVSLANRISPRINAQVHRMRACIEEANLTGILELVPAYASVLITYDTQVTEHAALTDALDALLVDLPGPDGLTTSSSGKCQIIPVQYGGEGGSDLDEVARIHGLSADDVIKIHSGRDYRVNFLGFLPGFAYLGTVSSRIVTPRLSTPRARINAGSLGIAGGQTAIYPFASPGGWRIIGRTSLPVWDTDAQAPARFLPGDVVRFVPSAYEPPLQEYRAEPAQPRLPAFEVVTEAGVSMVQDLGRPKLAHLGVSQGGAFDALAAVRANALAGNPPEAPVLEMTWTGPTLRALRNLTIALDGADFECRVDGALVPTGLSWFIRRGSEIRFSRGHPGRGGVRGYLAVSGGIDAPKVLGSSSTSTLAHFGGYAGRPLKVGDILGVGQNPGDLALTAGKYWLGKTLRIATGNVALRFVPFRGRGEAIAAARRAFTERDFVLTDRADRMGYVFRPTDGEALPKGGRELISFGVVRGAIQLPPDGNPVVLNVDHQTTGGYPLLGVVIRADWAVLAQMAPGAKAHFVEVTIDEARTAYSRDLHDLDWGLRLLGQQLPSGLG
jgi:KipI family sensor histidine kinase inhibitor